MKAIRSVLICFAVLLLLPFVAAAEAWKEEALLHDGTKIIVERTVKRGGRHEVGQQHPIAEQMLTFVLPSTREKVTWNDPFSPDIGSANFLPMLLEMHGNAAYLVAFPMGCLSYNKWGRPNPPYVVFKYEGAAWNRISLKELPAELSTPNLIFSSPDTEARKSGESVVSAETIKSLYSAYRQSEFISILREPFPQECEERVLYKGYWILPKDPIARTFIDSQQK